jgi:hypothetical protein
MPGVPEAWLTKLMAATLYGGPSAVASGKAAGRLLGFPGFDRAAVEISTRRRTRQDGLLIHRVPSLPEQPGLHIHGIPVTSVETTLLDLCATETPSRIKTVVRDALRRKATTIEKLDTFMGHEARSGVRGIRVLRRTLEICDGREQLRASQLEDRFAHLMRKAHLYPVAQYVIALGNSFLKRPDFVFVHEMVAIELDSLEFHSDRVAFERDRETDVVLGNLGWRVLRFTWAQLRDRPDWVVQQVIAAVAQGRAAREPVLFSSDENRRVVRTGER